MSFYTDDHYLRDVVTSPKGTSLCDVGYLMGRRAVGCVVIVDDEERPVGILTDRDLTCRAIARDLDLDKATAADVMTEPLVTATPRETIEEVVARMRSHRIRRLPVLENGKLVGIVTLDDVLSSLGNELSYLGTAARRRYLLCCREARKEHRREDLRDRIQQIAQDTERAGAEFRTFLGEELEKLRSRLTREEE